MLDSSGGDEIISDEIIYIRIEILPLYCHDQLERDAFVQWFIVRAAC